METLTILVPLAAVAIPARSGAGLEAGGPRWPACRGAACSY